MAYELHQQYDIYARIDTIKRSERLNVALWFILIRKMKSIHAHGKLSLLVITVMFG